MDLTKPAPVNGRSLARVFFLHLADDGWGDVNRWLVDEDAASLTQLPLRDKVGNLFLDFRRNLARLFFLLTSRNLPLLPKHVALAFQPSGAECFRFHLRSTSMALSASPRCAKDALRKHEQLCPSKLVVELQNLRDGGKQTLSPNFLCSRGDESSRRNSLAEYFLKRTSSVGAMLLRIPGLPAELRPAPRASAAEASS